MQLDRLTARIRPRRTWEGIDLGFALGRHWFLPLWGLWWLGALPFGVAAALWLPERPDLWVLLVWWLKPLYEAPLLFWLSRALFGAPPGPRDLWRERSKVLPMRLLPGLLWRRLNASRSFQLPLTQLEGLRGRARRRRWRVLQGTGGTGDWLTMICLQLESVLWVSALVLVLYLVPAELPRLDPAEALFEVESAAYWVSAVLYWLAMSVMAPFYVAAGFGLYLTRRTELEAWDLELVFRSAEVREDGGRTHAPSVALMSVLLVLTSWSTPGLQAAVKDLDPSEARAVVTEVLASEEFGEKEQIQTWVYVGTMGEDRGGVALPEWLRDFFTLLAQGANPVAILMKWILVLLAVVVGVFVLRRILIELRGRRYKRSVATESYEEPQLIGRAGDQVPPADVEVRVHRLIAAGDLRAALALLYQATLFRLVQQFSLGIPASATELECLELVRRARPAYETVLLQNLIEAWRRLAYGHRAPDSDEVAALLRDWRQWQGSPGGV